MKRIICIPIALLIVSCGEKKAPRETQVAENKVVQQEAKQETDPQPGKKPVSVSEPEALPVKEKTILFVPPVMDREEDLPPMQEIWDVDDNVGTIDREYYSDAPPPPPPRPQDPEIYDFVDEPAEFPGGMTALRDYLAKNYVVPESLKATNYKGKVYVRFVVSTQGNISNVKVVRGAVDCPDCDKEAIRVVKSMPAWKPGTVGGKPVNSYYNLPVRVETVGP